jgi:hypothetical protein
MAGILAVLMSLSYKRPGQIWLGVRVLSCGMSLLPIVAEVGIL